MKRMIGHQTLEVMKNAGWYNNWLLNQISKYLSGDILEVGAGIGNFTSKLSKYEMLQRLTMIQITKTRIMVTLKAINIFSKIKNSSQ